MLAVEILVIRGKRLNCLKLTYNLLFQRSLLMFHHYFMFTDLQKKEVITAQEISNRRFTSPFDKRKYEVK